MMATLFDALWCRHFAPISLADPNGNGADDHMDTTCGVCKDVSVYLVHDDGHH